MWHIQKYAYALWLIIVTVSAASDTLQFVHVLFRHGDRSPISTFTNDQFKEDSWPQGFGQLTQQGMQQEYKLGRWLRNRYNGFLNEEYVRQQVYVRSTDYDRALMSAYSVLAGLFPPPPRGYQQWNQNISWQPIPVHTIPKDEDWFLLDPPCPVLSDIFEKRNTSDEIAIENEFKHDLEVLKNETGDNLTSIFDTLYIYDALLCEKLNSKPNPDWFSDGMHDRFVEKVIPVQFRRAGSSVQERRLKGGVIVGQILRDWKIQLDNETTTPLKMMIFSAHDSTVIKLLAALDAFDWHEIHYSACVMVELHYLESTGYYVQVFFRNTSDSVDAVQQHVRGCGEICTLTNFSELMKPIIPVDRFRECYSFRDTDTYSQQLVIIVVSVIFASLLTSLVCGFIAHRKCHRHKVRSYGQIRHRSVPEQVPMMLHSVGEDSDQDEEM